jgi:hypothetical protein
MQRGVSRLVFKACYGGDNVFVSTEAVCSRGVTLLVARLHQFGVDDITQRPALLQDRIAAL